jgi:hypothetical protein
LVAESLTGSQNGGAGNEGAEAKTPGNIGFIAKKSSDSTAKELNKKNHKQLIK